MKSAEEIARKYGGVAVSAETDTSGAPDAAAIAKKYGGTVATTPAPPAAPKSHGASGSFIEPDIAQRFQMNHPILSAPLQWMVEFGKSATDAAISLVTAPYHALTDPYDPNGVDTMIPSTMGPGERAIARMTIGPQVHQFEKADEAKANARRSYRAGDKANAIGYGAQVVGHTLAAEVPFAGPFVADLAEKASGGELPSALGQLAMTAILGYAAHEFASSSPSSSISPSPIEPTTRTVSGIASRIKSGVGEQSVDAVTRTVLPTWKKAASELGTDLEQSLASKFPSRAITESSKRTMTNAGEHALEIADHAVDITQRPFNDVLEHFGDVRTSRPQFGGAQSQGTPDVFNRVLDRLEDKAAENDNVNQPLSNAMRAMAERVRANGGTFGGMNGLKVLANKKSAQIFNKTGQAAVNSSADVAYAWRELGDTIRAEMYPELSRMSGVDLRQAGSLEADMMDARDGLRHNYYRDTLPAHAARMEQSYFDRLVEGSKSRNNIVARALNMARTPAGDFNLKFRNAMQDMPATPNVVPIYPGTNPNIPPTLSGAQQDLLPTGAPGSEPLLAPPPGMANARNVASGSTMGEDIFRVQQRANREARIAPPPTLSGTQSSIAEHALPDSPFYPGASGIKEEIITGPDGKPVRVMRDYREQSQLFSHYQTPYKWEPHMAETSTFTDLTNLAHQIKHYLDTETPPPTVRAQWESDLQRVVHEINRRITARSVVK